ncbi:MAG: hypothetical protein WBP89_16485 [Sedimenticolaceae bacterium]
MTALLDIEGELILERNGVEAMRIEASGPLVRAQIYRASTAVGLARTLHLPSRAARRQVTRVAALLTHVDVTLEVQVGSRRVAQLGSGARSGLLERALGLEGLQLHLINALIALLSGSGSRRGPNV